ncbi:MAG: hypothetical protein P4L36_10140 [Holophaga sp.]|nr:hypothetical protein [Holophaga sp.]
MDPDRTERGASGPAPAAVCVAWHSLSWLVLANAIGVLTAVLLLAPGLHRWLGEWTYGRWVRVHMNLELYGWMSLPMAGFLMEHYGADRGPTAAWCRPVLWAWSTALAVGAVSWLTGHSSGKLFLDETGFARQALPLAMVALWLLLAAAFIRGAGRPRRPARSLGEGAVLLLLLAVPALLWRASSPAFYPPVNPDTGGPTGASQLESSLAVVGILLCLPLGLARRLAGRPWPVRLSWAALAAEALFCGALGRTDPSPRHPLAWLILVCLLIWIPLTPAYYASFAWSPGSGRWRKAMLGWWSLLLVTGWVLFLPGVLDHVKFTDGLVGHSLLAMAGFASSLVIFGMVHWLGEDGWIFNRTWSFYGWNGGVLAYVLLMALAGWREGSDPGYTIVPGMARDLVYALRLLAGSAMFAASLEWLCSARSLLRAPSRAPSAGAPARERRP